MDDKLLFKCEICGKTTEIAIKEEGKKVPVCCGQPMKDVSDLPYCDTSGNSEHGRLHKEDEPCKEQDE